MKRNILIFVFAMVLYSALAQAQLGGNYTTLLMPNQTLDVDIGTSTAVFGYSINISANADIFISGFNKTSDDGSIRGYVRNFNETNVTTCFFVNDYCSFNDDIVLRAGEAYLIVSDGNGTAVNRFRNDNALGFFHNISDLFILSASYTNGNFHPADVYTIQSMNISNTDPSIDLSNLQVTLNSPLDNVVLSNLVINFNSTYSTTSVKNLTNAS